MNRALRLVPPISHVRTVPRPYDWQRSDPELCGEADATAPHGIDRESVDVHGWLRTSIG